MAQTVLIIDDDKWIAMSTSMVLEDKGFEVQVFVHHGLVRPGHPALQDRPEVADRAVGLRRIPGGEDLVVLGVAADDGHHPLVDRHVRHGVQAIVVVLIFELRGSLWASIQEV